MGIIRSRICGFVGAERGLEQTAFGVDPIFLAPVSDFGDLEDAIDCMNLCVCQAMFLVLSSVMVLMFLGRVGSTDEDLEI